MSQLRLILCLAFFIPACALLGAMSTLDSGLPIWCSLTVGTCIGIFFGGNHKWKVWDYIFGPQQPRDDSDDGDDDAFANKSAAKLRSKQF